MTSILITAVAAASAAEWTRFRGPNGSGISDAETVPTEWSDEAYRWVTALPGAGHSSPVVWGDRIFLTSADADAGKRWGVCVDAADGKILWQREFGFETYKKHLNNSFATSTPCVDAQRVYFLWQAREESSLVAVSHEGEPLWQHDLGPFRGGHGGAISPILYDGMVIVGNDQEAPSYLLALDAETGTERWKVDRQSTRATYATPCIYDVPGRQPEVIFTDWEHGITGVDASDGKVHWEIDLFGDFKQRAIGSPIVAGDLVIGTSGFTTAEKNVVAVKPEGTGTNSTVREVWRISRAVPHIPTPIAFGPWLFLWSDRGIVTCANANTGETVWQKRVGGNYSSSPIIVDGRIYCVEESGEVVVLEASGEFKLLARNTLGQPSRATPAVSGGRMYLRSFSHLYSLGGEQPVGK